MSEEHFFCHPALPCIEGRRSVDSSRHFKRHMHRRFSIGAIDKGEVRYQVAGQGAVLSPGSLALINPEVIHSCNPLDSARRSYSVLYLDVDWCSQVQESLWQESGFVPVERILLEDVALYSQFLRIMTLLMGGFDILLIEQHVTELVGQIFLRCCGRRKRLDTACVQVKELKRLLGEGLDASLSLNQVAAGLGVNPYTLLRQFKKEMGITPHAYRLNLRIELSRELLQQGLEPARVALECGFFDQSHFHRHFKAHTTVTPREYQVNFVQ